MVEFEPTDERLVKEEAFVVVSFLLEFPVLLLLVIEKDQKDGMQDLIQIKESGHEDVHGANLRSLLLNVNAKRLVERYLKFRQGRRVLFIQLI